ncbi:hypothetical protein C1646_749250 [Rhizophagus diaphanus]|nr:hypothetical protein C1646_749250 [Rhizophagus diaphanus] [Rhizophagus sp. MUCL 43196]
MPKHKEYTVTLISSGLIVDALHYGPFCHNWWISRFSEKHENPIFLHPIRLHMKILTNAKYLGPAVIGFDIPIISEALLKDLPFRAFLFSLGKLNIWELEDDYCQVMIYSGNELCNIYIDNNSELLHAWKSMLKNVGCTKITPFTKKQSEAVNINKNGYDEKTHILSIIAKKFSYEEIKSNYLNISNDAVHYTQNHTLIHGAGGQVWNKPVVTREKLSTEMQEQLQAFLMDKAHVVISLYKTDVATNEPLEKNKYIYRENLGSLCLTCQKYEYKIFSDLIEYINKYITQSYIQKQLIVCCENLKRFLKHDYEQHFHVTSNGMTFHNLCINYCLLYVFNQCIKSHTLTCNECQEFFNFFANIKTHSNEINYNDLLDMKEHLLYYLAHQTTSASLKSVDSHQYTC